MKTYNNKQTQEWYTEGNAITRRLSDSAIFSGVPTEEQLLEWGFEEYVPEPTPEPTEEELERLRLQNRLQEIEDELRTMDYLTSKYIDGEDMSQYGDWQDHRHELRLEYREIENMLNEE